MAKAPVNNDNRWAVEGKKAAKIWKKSRESKAGGGFSNPEIEDGNYVARVIKAKADFTKASKTSPSIPYVNLSLVVVDGDYNGIKLNRNDRLGGKDEDQTAGNLERFAKTMDGIGFNCAELELHEVPDLVKAINDEKPFVHISVKNSTGADGKEYLNVYCNKVVTDEEKSELGLSEDAGESESEDDKPAKKAPVKKAVSRRK